MQETGHQNETCIAYALIGVMIGVALYPIVWLRRERDQRHSLRCGKYRDDLAPPVGRGLSGLSAWLCRRKLLGQFGRH